MIFMTKCIENRLYFSEIIVLFVYLILVFIRKNLTALKLNIYNPIK